MCVCVIFFEWRLSIDIAPHSGLSARVIWCVSYTWLWLGVQCVCTNGRSHTHINMCSSASSILATSLVVVMVALQLYCCVVVHSLPFSYCAWVAFFFFFYTKHNIHITHYGMAAASKNETHAYNQKKAFKCVLYTECVLLSNDGAPPRAAAASLCETSFLLSLESVQRAQGVRSPNCLTH